MSKEAFYLFKSPMVVTPSRDLIRTICNPLNRFIYRRFYEQEYTHQGFLSGAKQAALIAAFLVRQSKYDELGAIMGQQATSYLKNRIAELPKSIVNDRLSFEDEDIAKIILHSSFFTIPYPFQSISKYDTSFYSTFILFIDKERKNLRSTTKLLKCPNVLVCNLTVGRRLQNPVGRWKVTDMNFFNRLAMDTFVSQDSHSYYFR